MVIVWLEDGHKNVREGQSMISLKIWMPGKVNDWDNVSMLQSKLEKREKFKVSACWCLCFWRN
jgi:hypothetical protein